MSIGDCKIGHVEVKEFVKSYRYLLKWLKSALKVLVRQDGKAEGCKVQFCRSASTMKSGFWLMRIRRPGKIVERKIDQQATLFLYTCFLFP